MSSIDEMLDDEELNGIVGGATKAMIYHQLPNGKYMVWRYEGTDMSMEAIVSECVQWEQRIGSGIDAMESMPTAGGLKRSWRRSAGMSSSRLNKLIASCQQAGYEILAN